MGRPFFPHLVPAAITSTFIRDVVGRLTSLVHESGGDVLEAYAWTFDARNRPTSYFSHADGLTTYAYDARGQLTGVDRPGTIGDEAYAYDDNGNRTASDSSTSDDVETVVTGLENRLLDDGTFTYEYDPEGNRTKRTRNSTDAADDFVTEYRWDQRNRRTGVTFYSDSAATVQTKRVEFVYDLFNRRIEKAVFDANDVSQSIERYVYDGEQAILDLDGANQIVRRNLYGAGVDEVLAMEEAGVTRWLLADNQGSIRQTADAAGALVGTTKYDAFGLVLETTGYQSRFGYNGADYDADTRENRMGRRDYDPFAQRWTSEDPIQERSGQFNDFVFINNHVTYATDPTGMAELSTAITNRNGINTPNSTIPLSIGMAGQFTPTTFGEVDYTGLTRIGGVAQAAGGAFQAVGGFVFGLATWETGAGAVIGLGMMAKGLDNVLTGITQAWSGESQETMFKQFVREETGNNALATGLDIGLDFLGPGGARRALGLLDDAGRQLGKLDDLTRMGRGVPVAAGGGRLPGGAIPNFLSGPTIHYPESMAGLFQGPNKLGLTFCQGHPNNVKSTLDALPGKLGKTGPIKEVPDAKALDDLFNSLTKDAKTVPSGTYKGVVKELPDGTIVRMRTASKSGGAALDITMTNGRLYKVHIQ